MCLDPRHYPRSDTPPEEEFQLFLARFPAVARQFETAIAARPWVSTDRIQYSPRSTIGERYALTMHAAGFVDPLFSLGLKNNNFSLFALAEQLIASKRTGDYSTGNFEPIDALKPQLLSSNDRLVHCSYIAMHHFRLWKAWLRVYSLGEYLGGFWLNLLWTQSSKLSDKGKIAKIASVICDLPFPDSLSPIIPEWKTFFDRVATLVEQTEDPDDPRDPSAAADEIFKLLHDSDFIPPAMRFHDESRTRMGYVTFDELLDDMRWFNRWITRQPTSLQKRYYANGTPPRLQLDLLPSIIKFDHALWTVKHRRFLRSIEGGMPRADWQRLETNRAWLSSLFDILEQPYLRLSEITARRRSGR